MFYFNAYHKVLLMLSENKKNVMAFILLLLVSVIAIYLGLGKIGNLEIVQVFMIKFCSVMVVKDVLYSKTVVCYVGLVSDR